MRIGNRRSEGQMRWPLRCSCAPTMAQKKKTSPTKSSPANKRTIKSPKASAPRMSKKSTTTSQQPAKKAPKKTAKK
jgi:hypothetical protein